MKHRLVLTLALVALTSTAHADAPPPDGKKHVGYAFKIQGLAAFPDHVVVAWPWSLSNGSPTREYAVLTDETPLRVGRRSPTVKLYAVGKAAWEAFVKAELNNAQPDNDAQVSALNAFLVAPNAAACNENPNDIHVISDSDPRSVVEDVFSAKMLSASSCELTRTSPAITAPKSSCSNGGTALASLLGLIGVLGLRALTRRRGVTSS
jgi:hypothetical protein